MYEASQDIAYLDNVIQESLRLYPPAPRWGTESIPWASTLKMFCCIPYYCRTSRECRETTVIKGVTIPKGAIVMIPIFLIQLDPQYWKNPKQFDPDR